MKVRSLFGKQASLVACAAFALVFQTAGQALTDPGFEAYALVSGGFVKPASGPWTFSNDAGVVEPFSPNSSLGSLNTWSATFSALEGQQYASTYAGADTIKQLVSFPSPGRYVVSAYAAAPSGTVTIPQVATLTLVDGEFTFTLNNAAVGTAHTIQPGTPWTPFSAEFQISTPGDYVIGIQNTASAPYFINYDAFAIQPVPEPAAVSLLLMGALVTVTGRRFRARKP